MKKDKCNFLYKGVNLFENLQYIHGIEVYSHCDPKYPVRHPMVQLPSLRSHRSSAQLAWQSDTQSDPYFPTMHPSEQFVDVPVHFDRKQLELQIPRHSSPKKPF